MQDQTTADPVNNRIPPGCGFCDCCVAVYYDGYSGVYTKAFLTSPMKIDTFTASRKPHQHHGNFLHHPNSQYLPGTY